MARPRNPLFDEQTEKEITIMISMGCTIDQIAATVHLRGYKTSRNTLKRRYGPRLKEGCEQAGSRIMTDLFKQSAAGKTAASIFLATQKRFGLGFENAYKSKQEISGPDGKELKINSWLDIMRAAQEEIKADKLKQLQGDAAPKPLEPAPDEGNTPD